jgi:ribonucleoside-triphosphate reductase (formate)
MLTEIIKRGGAKVPFDESKICKAIAKAGAATGEFTMAEAEELTRKVIHQLEKHEQEVYVEEVQDIVERTLMLSPYKKTAKAYIVYRDQHAQMRAYATSASLGLVDKYIDRADWQVKENSNMEYSLQGLNNYVFGEISKTYWLNKIYPKEVREAYEETDIHIHDLGVLSVYCVGWDLMDLLKTGFRGVKSKVESAPPKHLRTALGQAVNFMYTMQGEAAGAIAFSNFDTLLAPFIRYDGLTQDEVKQALQEFIFGMNVPTRVGFQTPFSNVTLDLTPSVNFKSEQVIIGGVLQREKYGEFQREMDMFNKAFFEVMAEGDAAGRVFTFPIPTVNITKDFDWGNKNLAGLWEITAKYGIPYFSNFITSDMKPEDTRSMCCRLRLDLAALDRRGGGLFGANALTGSIGVVTINIPRIAHVAKAAFPDDPAKASEMFFAKLGEKMDIAKESLEIKRKLLERLTDANLYPYTKFYLRDIKAAYGKYWENHFSTIGLLGTNEAALNLLGENIATAKGKKYAEDVLDFMRERLVKYQEETGNLYNLEATPGEGTSYRFAKSDTKKYPHIIVANDREHKNGKAHPYYTNSSHLPVNHTTDIFEALSHQDTLQAKYTGGTVVHLFLGERIADPSSVPGLVKKICENFTLPYFTLTPTFSVCQSHGYLKGEQPACSICAAPCEVYSRVVGYIRPVSQWNEGKQAEYDERFTYEPQICAPSETVKVATLA